MDFFAPLTKILNTYLESDPHAKKRLKPLAGKIIAITSGWGDTTTCYLMCEKNGFQLRDGLPAKTAPHLTLSGPPLGFLALFKEGNFDAAAMQKHHIHFEGSESLARDLGRLFSNHQIDWEGQLAYVVGDLLAHPIAKQGATFSQWLAESKAAFKADLKAYLHTEKEWIPHKEALESFYEGVDEVRSEQARSAARIDRLAAKFKKQTIIK